MNFYIKKITIYIHSIFVFVGFSSKIFWLKVYIENWLLKVNDFISQQYIFMLQPTQEFDQITNSSSSKELKKLTVFDKKFMEFSRNFLNSAYKKVCWLISNLRQFLRIESYFCSAICHWTWIDFKIWLCRKTSATETWKTC